MSELNPAIENLSATDISHYLFWTTLILGAVSGVASYFILRFSDSLTWYVLAPILFGVNIVFLFLLINHRQRSEKPVGNKQILRFILKYSGTWIIVYFAAATAIFYFGW